MKSMVRRGALAGLVGAVLGSGLVTATGADALTLAGTAANRTVLQVSPTTVITGQTTYLRAVVRPTAPGAAPTGMVTFLDGVVVLGTAPLAASTGGVQAAKLAHGFNVGSHSLTARYAGEGAYASSASLPVPFTVGRAASTSKVTVAAAQQPGTYDVVVVEKAVAPGRGSVSGTVTVQVDTLAPQSLALNADGRAHLTLALAKGSHTAKVTYLGDHDFIANSGSLTFAV